MAQYQLKDVYNRALLYIHHVKDVIIYCLASVGPYDVFATHVLGLENKIDGI